VSVAYYSLVPPVGLALGTTPKYEAVRFWDYNERPRELAYDHDAILGYARRLGRKCSTRMIWSLLLELHRDWTAYQRFEPPDKRNCKKILSSGPRASGQKSKGGRHRPAMLYQFSSQTPTAVEVF
jgi:hypothetical protein